MKALIIVKIRPSERDKLSNDYSRRFTESMKKSNYRQRECCNYLWVGEDDLAGIKNKIYLTWHQKNTICISIIIAQAVYCQQCARRFYIILRLTESFIPSATIIPVTATETGWKESMPKAGLFENLQFPVFRHPHHGGFRKSPADANFMANSLPEIKVGETWKRNRNLRQPKLSR